MDSKNASYEELQHRVAELENLLATKQSAAVPSSKQIYREMFECLEMAIIVQDADTGEFLDVNNGFCSMFGYSRAEALDGLLETIINDAPPFSKNDLLGWLDKVNRDGPQTFEWLSRKKNGDKFWTQVQLKHFRVDGKKCILAVIEDIHEQKILRENLQKSKDNVREILDKLDAMVFIHDTVTFELIDVNSQVTSRLGITYQDAVGGTIEDLSDGAPPYSQKEVLDWVRKARDEGPQIFDWFYKRKDGTRFWGEVHLKKATIGNDERIIAIAHDITEKKRIQEALEKRITALTRPLDDTGGIAFEDLFNLEDIQRLQDEFAAATGVASLITRTDGTPITQPSFFTRMCGSFIRQTEKGRKRCEKSDAALGKLCQDGPIVRNCLSCGFRGAGAGISVGGRHIANWLIGQVRDESQSEEQIRNYAREIGAEEEEFVRAFYEVPTMDPAEFDRISKVLFTLANQLSHIAYQNIQQARFIADRKNAESTLQKEKEFIETLLNNLPGLFYIFDLEGNILRWNKSAEKIIGYSTEEISGMKILEFFPPEEAEKSIESTREVVEKGHAYLEANLMMKDGSKAPYYFSSYTTTIDGKECIVGMAIDITDRKEYEEKLRYFQMAVEGATDAIGMATPEGLHFYQNKAYTKMFGGMSVEEVQGESGPPSTVFENEAEASRIFEIMKSGGSWSGEIGMVDKAGKHLDVLLRTYSLKNESGMVTGLVGIHSDISEMKRAEKALRESEEKYRTIYNNALAGMFRTKIEDGLVLECNNQSARILGYDTRDDLIGKLNVADIYVDPDDRSHILEMLKQSGEIDKYDCRFVKKDGNPVWIRISARIYPESGYLEGILVDIDAEKNAAGALRESEEKYRTFFNSVQIGMFRTRISDGKLLECNEQLANSFGYASREECLNELVASEKYVVPSDRNRLIEELKEHGEVDEFETSYYRKDGQIFWVKLTGRIFPERDYLEGFIRDVTAQKNAEVEKSKLEEQLLHAQKMESIGRLAGGVAHDFSNMLTPIIGYAELALMDMDEQDKLYEPLTTIMKAAESASALTKQLLAFSRKQVLQLKRVNLNEVVVKFSKMIQRLIGENIELRMSLAPELGKVKVDVDQIDQILMNLAVNARDAMPGGGKLTIETSNLYLDNEYVEKHPYARKGPHIMLAVTDNGCGMNAEVQRHIFEPFYTTKGLSEGTGLGLSTVYGLAKQHGGHIQVYSEVGHGTTFKIYFPRAEDEEVTGKAASEPSKQHVPGGTETVLIVEDEELIRKLASEIIELNGYQVLCADSGNEALKLAEKHQGTIDLLLTDVIMPGMNGKELHQRIQQFCPGIKVIFTSGYTDNVITHHGVLDEGVNFLQKPFSAHSLLAKIRGTLDSLQD